MDKVRLFELIVEDVLTDKITFENACDIVLLNNYKEDLRSLNYRMTYFNESAEDALFYCTENVKEQFDKIVTSLHNKIKKLKEVKQRAKLDSDGKEKIDGELNKLNKLKALANKAKTSSYKMGMFLNTHSYEISKGLAEYISTGGIENTQQILRSVGFA